MSADTLHPEESNETSPNLKEDTPEDYNSDDSIISLRALADSLYIPGSHRMNREALLYAIHKAQGGDGGLTI
ncbi:MAG TPA: Rho termination factor N-terminal domain-containing protein [Oligoflexus sp.]|uniref:Rho termination factor N-terminal domain-containing protein n=1 Tax=Oligoflexus sp. TaxID=1971216 RepID=UPI002D2A7FC2|nr:Rho termination factor N-terminal domain-containing protein [Oligoflexus sp.]HYX39282.1 Rho termination factor N-terminal domain-containing protein [Oligoflexus sp.]